MSNNSYDQGCRYLTKQEPEGVLRWPPGLSAALVRFLGWMKLRDAGVHGRAFGLASMGFSPRRNRTRISRRRLLQWLTQPGSPLASPAAA